MAIQILLSADNLVLIITIKRPCCYFAARSFSFKHLWTNLNAKSLHHDCFQKDFYIFLLCDTYFLLRIQQKTQKAKAR